MACVVFNLKKRPTQADGSKCITCGDNVYGSAAELILIADNGKEVGTLEGQICGSCADVIDIDQLRETI
ncbi:hypothetical protein LCGC14_2238790 [marine sediment metagenome]|uniref:Uncharacterized protein n=1 Tax=marine sediment metagenome TaxID=412755 RepID=A0A0F9G135_9ZZZZ